MTTETRTFENEVDARAFGAQMQHELELEDERLLVMPNATLTGWSVHWLVPETATQAAGPEAEADTIRACYREWMWALHIYAREHRDCPMPADLLKYNMDFRYAKRGG